MAATARDKAVAKRMGEIMLALRARYFEDKRAGRCDFWEDEGTGIPLSELGKDSITHAALQQWQKGKYIKIERGMVRFDGMGFHEAFRIEERKDEPEQQNDTPDIPNMFGAKAGE